MATNVGTLNINIQAGTAQFDEAMNKVQQGLKNAVITGSALGSAIGNLFEKLTEQAGELAREMLEFARSIIDTDEQMGNLAQVTGTTSEKFSVLAYGAKLANVSMDELSQAMSHLGKQIALAVSGNSDAIALFNALGISFQDAKKQARDTGDVIVDLAKKFAQYRDDANKTNAAQDLLGKSGSRMIPYLNSLGINIGELTKKLQEYGGVTNKAAAEQASKFNEQLADMQEHARGVARTILNPLIPSVNAFISDIGDAVTGVGKLIDKLGELGKQKLPVGDKQYDVVDVIKAADKVKEEQDKAQINRLKSIFEYLKSVLVNADALEGISRGLGLSTDALTKRITSNLKDLQPYIEAAKKAREESEKNKSQEKKDDKQSLKLPIDTGLAHAIEMYREHLKQLTDATAAQRILTQVVGQGTEAEAVATGVIDAENHIREINAARIKDKKAVLTDAEKATLTTAAVEKSLATLAKSTADGFDQQVQSMTLAVEQQQNLTDAAGQGADAMEAAQLRNLELAATFNKAMDLLGDKGPAVMKQLNDAWKRAADLQREAKNKELITQIQDETKALDDQISSINEMTVALLKDDAAQQQVERDALKKRQEQEYAIQQREGASQKALDALSAKQARDRDALAAQQKLQTEQQARQDIQGPEENYLVRKKNLEDEAKLIEEVQGHALSYGQTLTYLAKQYDAVIQKNQAMLQLLLRSNNAMDGVNAFLLELQINAKTTAQTIHDVLAQTFEGLTDYLAKVMTGTKASFSDLMRSIAEMIAKSAIQNLLTDLLRPKPGQGTTSSVLGGLFSSLGGLFGHRQGGGPISAGRAWIVGENGPEIITGVSGYVHNAAMTRGMLGGPGAVINYAIDARGTDPALTERRTRAAIIAAHQSSVVTSIQASSELMKRRPPKGA